MPSIALSNSASEALRHTAHSRIRAEINYAHVKQHATTGKDSAHVQEVVDELDLVVHGERSFREVAQESERGQHSAMDV